MELEYTLDEGGQPVCPTHGPDTREAAVETVRVLTVALLATLRALEQHLSDEAKAQGVAVDRLCPCHDGEVRRAREVLRAVGVDPVRIRA